MIDHFPKAVENIRRWKASPCAFVYELFGVEPDPWQRKALEAFASGRDEDRRIALQACAGPGKSAVLAWMGHNFLSCYADRGYHPNGLAISVTAENLKDNLWKEMAVWRGRSEFLTRAFDMNDERIFQRQHQKTWFIAARSWPKTASTEEQGKTLSGLHARYILYLIDESGAIPPPVLKAAEQGLGNCVWGKIAQAGNPLTREGMLYECVTKLRHRWNVIIITGDPDDPDRSQRIDIKWARQQIEDHGRDDPWVMAYILGQFPPSSLNALLGPDEVAAAMKRRYKEDAYSWAQRRLGADVARFGDDRTSLFPRQGLVAFKNVIMRNADGPEIAGRIIHAKSKWPFERGFIDDTGGWGASAQDACRQAGLVLIPVNFSSKSPDPRYFNMRSYMWFEMAKWVKKGGALPHNPQLLRELTTPTYTLWKGKLRLEEKDQIKKRLGFSTDEADSLGLTFSQPDEPASDSVMAALRRAQQHGSVLKDWDPLAEARA